MFAPSVTEEALLEDAGTGRYLADLTPGPSPKGEGRNKANRGRIALALIDRPRLRLYDSETIWTEQALSAKH